MTQLSLPIPEIDPRIQLQAARRLQRMIDARRKSFECRDYRRRRTAALKSTRQNKEMRHADCSR